MGILLLIPALISISIWVILLIGIYQKNTNRVCMSKRRLDGKTVLVTGGTAGMGLEIAKDFAQRGARVIVACPFEEEGVQGVQTIKECSENQNVEFKILDLASFESTRKFVADIVKNEDRLDILVNNAGVGGPRDAVTRDGLNYVMQVNYYGAFLLTILLLPLLKKTGCPGEPSRILNITSAAHNLGTVNFDDLDAHSFPVQAYANSKLYGVLFSRELTKGLEGSNVVINNVDPGAVGTNIFVTFTNQYIGIIFTSLFFIAFKTPWQGIQTALQVALDKKAGEVSGEYFKNCKQARAKSTAYNDKVAKRLWEVSVRKVRLTKEELLLHL